MKELFGLRDQFGPAAAKAKSRAIRRMAARPPASPRDIRRAHDELLYHVAYPDSPATSRAAVAALRALVRAAPRMENAAELDNSGIAGTKIRTTFSIDLLRWLRRRGHRMVAIDWDNDESTAAIDRLIPLICSPAEIDGVFSNRRSTREWVQRASRQHASELAWLLEQLERAAAPTDWLDDWFASLSLPILWKLGRDSRTFSRFPARPIFCIPGGLAKKVDLSQLLESTLPRPVRVTPSEREALIDTARATLAARARETDPVTYANPRDVALFRLERGIDVALFGMVPERRLPIESYVGFAAARNRVPIAYGGSWIFGRRCEIGVNLFEEFRGGESALIFGQVMRTYRQRFNVTQFLVDPFQFGADNEEAIRSGAFWFYYRLGFRPIDPKARVAAEREAKRLQENPGARTTHRLLRRFATGKIFLDAPLRATPPAAHIPVAPNLESLGLAVSDWIADRFRGDRAAAQAIAKRWIEHGISAHVPRVKQSTRSWSIATRSLAPLFAAINDRRRIAKHQWTIIADILLARCAATDRRYIQAWQTALPYLSPQFAAF